MSYYLIDFENVKSRGMEGVELLAKEDTVCIFYSDNADSMTFDLHRKLNETKAQIIYHKVAVGTKNALDFQLATYLGYLICEQQKEGIHPDYFIVTKDNGFTSLMVYWKAQGVPVRITRNLLWGKNPTAEQNPAVEENAEEMTGSVERESVQNLLVEEAEPVAVEITEQETEKTTGSEPEKGSRRAADRGDNGACICERADPGRTVAGDWRIRWHGTGEHYRCGNSGRSCQKRGGACRIREKAGKEKEQ